MNSTEDPISALATRVALLEARVAELEKIREVARAARPPAAPAVAVPAAAPTVPHVEAARIPVALIGRSLIVLGGAYLLRAITDLHYVPDAVGVTSGLVFAAALVAVADRGAGRGRSTSSAFHAATALIIAYPLVGEMVARFQLIGALPAALLVAAFAAATLTVAARWRLAALAWLATLATAVAAATFAVQTRQMAPFALLLTALLAAAGGLARAIDQRFLVWPVAIVADMVLVAFNMLVLWHRTPGEPWGAVAVDLGFFAVSAGGALAHDLRDRTPATIFEMLQTGVAFLVALLPAARIAAGLAGAVGFAVFVAGAGAAVIVLALRAFAGGRNLAFWTSAGLAVVLTAFGVALDGAALALADVLPAAALLVVVRRRSHPAGELQALAALGAAALSSGLVGVAALGLGAPTAELATPEPGAVVVLVALIAAAIVGIREPATGARPTARVAKIAALSLVTLGIGGLLSWAGIAVTGSGPPAAATLRTGVLSLGAVVLALASRHPRVRSAALLIYPVLGLTAAKIIIEDMRIGVAATLFGSLALLGAALIAAPRLRPAA